MFYKLENYSARSSSKKIKANCETINSRETSRAKPFTIIAACIELWEIIADGTVVAQGTEVKDI